MATIESLAADLAAMKSQVTDIYNSSPAGQVAAQEAARALQMEQTALQSLQQERQFLSQLQMEGYSKADAIAYYNRMKSGEKPWLDDAR